MDRLHQEHEFTAAETIGILELRLPLTRIGVPGRLLI